MNVKALHQTSRPSDIKKISRLFKNSSKVNKSFPKICPRPMDKIKYILDTNCSILNSIVDSRKMLCIPLEPL